MFESAGSLLATAFILGFTAGISPGVLFALVVSESIQHGAMAGIKVGLAPFITDLPIVLLAVFIFNQLSGVNIVLAFISFAGGLYLFYLGYKDITVQSDLNIKMVKTNSLKKGVITNFLSPDPYVFWLSIGANLLSKSFDINVTTGIFFLLIFYVSLVGMKIVIAIVTSKLKKFIGGKIYFVVLKLLGFILIGLGFIYMYNGYLKLAD